MIHIKEAIVVEGTYDATKLSSITDAYIIKTNGFSVYKNKEKIELIRKLAETRGVVILTDSDYAGFRIRNYLKQCIGCDNIKNAYIPEIKGKEKRKKLPGKEGLLGVEGMDVQVIIDALSKAGCTVDGAVFDKKSDITRQMLYADGFIGMSNSAEKRQALQKELAIPSKLSTSALLQTLNIICTKEEYEEAVKKISLNTD